ncbi:DUF192 domain-containing protein [Rhodospirillum rubrum]|nr:DUF192 domain-containing protein [Rhodospirillum rubrum]
MMRRWPKLGRRDLALWLGGAVCLALTVPAPSAAWAQPQPSVVRPNLGLDAPPDTRGRFAKSKLTIVTDDGRSLPFFVELATTANQRALGLMFRKDLAADAGMLFVWDEPGQRAMWMKNTLIGLDMLFLDAEGLVVGIAENAEPGSLRHIEAPEPCVGVLELNAGTTRLLSIDPGDRVVHPLLGGPAEGAMGAARPSR